VLCLSKKHRKRLGSCERSSSMESVKLVHRAVAADPLKLYSPVLYNLIHLHLPATTTVALPRCHIEHHSRKYPKYSMMDSDPCTGRDSGRRLTYYATAATPPPSEPVHRITHGTPTLATGVAVRFVNPLATPSEHANHRNGESSTARTTPRLRGRPGNKLVCSGVRWQRS